MTLTPAVPKQGQIETICYDAEGLSLTQVTIDLTWNPSGLQPTSITIQIEEGVGCHTVTVPDTAEHLKLTDTTGNTPSMTTTVLPANVPAR